MPPPAGQNTYSPLVDAGLGFGTLPPSLKYLRPFAITAEFSTTSPGQDWINGTPYVTTFNWGFTLQYSLPYFNSHVASIDNDFLKRLIPVAEFAFQTPIHNGGAAGQPKTGYFQPGLIYEADKWQFALEAMIPMTGATGHGAGVVGSLDIYLDDIPNRIDEPIFPHGFGIAPGILTHAQHLSSKSPPRSPSPRRDRSFRPRPARKLDAPGRGHGVFAERDPARLQRRRRAEIHGVTVTGPGGAAALGAPSVEAGHQNVLIVPVAKPLSPGVYTVKWRAVSVDTHHTQGTFEFTVK